MKLSILCLAAVLAAPLPAFAASAPPPPTQAQIKACVQQMDPNRKWVFDWKEITVGAPRPPQNIYESVALFGRTPTPSQIGYPVHAVYRLGDLKTIDAEYWFLSDGGPDWEVPLLCRIKRAP